MRRINHPPIPHENPHMLHRAAGSTISILAPEDQIPGLSLRARDMLAHAGVILRVCRAGDLLVEGLADGVLG